MSDTFKHKDIGKFHNKILKYDEVCESTKQMWDRHNGDRGEFRKAKKDLIEKIAEKEMKNTVNKEALKELENCYKALEKIENRYSAEKFEYKEEDYWIKQINNLDRFTTLSNGETLEDLDGEYVLFSDVLKLFSAKTDLEKVTNLTLDVQSGLLRSVERLVKTIKDDEMLGKEIRERFGEK